MGGLPGFPVFASPGFVADQNLDFPVRRNQQKAGPGEVRMTETVIRLPGETESLLRRAEQAGGHLAVAILIMQDADGILPVGDSGEKHLGLSPPNGHVDRSECCRHILREAPYVSKKGDNGDSMIITKTTQPD